MLESLFNKVASLQACNFIKKRFQQKFAKFLRTPFLTEHLEAVFEEAIEEEEQNFPCLYEKGNRATKKKIGKRTHGLGCNMLPAATTKVHKL